MTGGEGVRCSLEWTLLEESLSTWGLVYRGELLPPQVGVRDVHATDPSPRRVSREGNRETLQSRGSPTGRLIPGVISGHTRCGVPEGRGEYDKDGDPYGKGHEGKGGSGKDLQEILGCPDEGGEVKGRLSPEGRNLRTTEPLSATKDGGTGPYSERRSVPRSE